MKSSARPAPEPAARLLAGLIVAGCLLLGIGCASGKSAEKRRRAEQREGDLENREGPSPETLAEHPCSNPDWATLPEQHRIDGDEPTGGEDEESDDADADTRAPPASEPE